MEVHEKYLHGFKPLSFVVPETYDKINDHYELNRKLRLYRLNDDAITIEERTYDFVYPDGVIAFGLQEIADAKEVIDKVLQAVGCN